MAALFIGKILLLISWIFVEHVERMLTLRSVDVVGLSFEGLVFALGESLVCPVIAPVVTLVPVVALVGVTLVEGSTMRVATLVVAIAASIALIYKMVNLVILALHHLVAEFAFCTKLNLLITLLCEGAVGHLQIEDVLEVLGDSHGCLVAEGSSALEVSVAILLMKRHVEPLNL